MASAALTAFAETFSDGMLQGDIAERLTCHEAEVMADLLREAGRPDGAETLIEFHALGDEEGDVHYDDEEEEEDG